MQEDSKPFDFTDFDTRRMLTGIPIYNRDTTESYTITGFILKDGIWYAHLSGDSHLYSSRYLTENFNYLNIAYHDRAFGLK